MPSLTETGPGGELHRRLFHAVLAFVVLVAPAVVTTPAQAADPYNASVSGMQLEGSTSSGTWDLEGTGGVSTNLVSGEQESASFTLSGAFIVGPVNGCSDFYGLGAGTYEVGDRTLSLFNVTVASAYPRLLKISGRHGGGSFAAVAETFGCYDNDRGFTGSVHAMTFVSSETDPEALLEGLMATLDEAVDRVMDAVPPNSAPDAPTLVFPASGQTFSSGSVQSFTIRTADPEGDAYFGVVSIYSSSGARVAQFQTAPAASESNSTGAPLRPLPPGFYTWEATASDGRSMSDPSPTRSFTVE